MYFLALLLPGVVPGRATASTPSAPAPKAVGIDLNVTLPGQGNWSMIAHEPTGPDGFEKLRTARWIGKP